MPPDRPAPKEIDLHYYQFNIGDYASHTRHLTRDEDLAYRRILDLYYLQEKPLPKEPQDVARLILMNDCSTDVQRVLNEFFVLGENGWENKRANEEISKFHSRSKQASDAGKASAEARKQRTLNGRSTDVQPNKKQETRNIKQETNKNIGRQAATASQFDFLSALLAEGVSQQTAADYLAVRKKKKGVNTETAFNGLKAEVIKAGYTMEQALVICCRQGWSGFNADWVDKGSKPMTQHQKNQAATARALFGSATRIIDMEDSNAPLITR